MKKLRLRKGALIGLTMAFVLLYLGTIKAQVDFTFMANVPDTIYVNNGCSATLDWGHPGSVTANCNTPGCSIVFFDVISISGMYSIGDQVEAGQTVLVTYQVDDNMGSTALFGFDIDFVDGVEPTFDVASLPADMTVDCQEDVPDETPIAVDNCPEPGGSSSGVNVGYQGTSGLPSNCEGGTYTRSWIATDVAGNTAVYTQNITVNPDTSDPIIDGSFGAGAVTTAQCGSEADNLAAYQNWFAAQLADFTAAASDPGGCFPPLSITPQTAPAFVAGCGAMPVTFFAFDACGNINSAMASFEIVDNTAPITITDADNQNVTIQCDGLGDDPQAIIQSYSDNFTVVDNCGAITWSNNYTGLSNGCGATGDASVVYTVTDACGNSDNITVNFTVQDLNPPNIMTGAIDQAVECDGNGNFADLTTWIFNRAGAIAEDVCTSTNDLILGINVSSDPTTDDPATALNNAIAAGCVAGTPATVASITVEFTYTDLCGNTSSTDADFTILDSELPQFITSPSHVTIACEQDVNAALTEWYNTAGGATGGDVCSSVSFRGQPDLATTMANFANSQTTSCGNTGNVAVDFFVRDACGNENPTSITRTFTVTDNAPPIIDSPANYLAVECDGNGNVTELNNWLNSNGGAVAHDDCGGILTWTNDFVGLTDGCGATGSGTVVFSAMDECGNTTSTTAAFSIQDTTAPVWDTDPVDLVINCDISADIDGQIAAWLANNGGGVASDVCSGVVYNHNYAGLAGQCGATGTASVTFTAMDDCGQATSEVATITVIDNTPPDISTTASNLSVACDGNGNITDLNDWLANNGGAMATDNCSAVTWMNDYNGNMSDGCGASGGVTVTFTATDACGLTATTTGTFTILDNEDPVIVNPATDAFVECENVTLSFAAWLDSRGGATATDNCSAINNMATSDPASSWSYVSLGFTPTCGNAGSETVTFTVTDACGNTSSTTATYYVVDNISPVINPTTTTTIEECGGGDDQTNLEAWINNTAGAMASDGCGDVDMSNYTWTTSDGATGAGAIGTGPYPVIVPNTGCTNGIAWQTSVTFIAQDECDNTSTSTSDFRLMDSTAPVITNIPMDVTVDCDEGAPGTPTATDICDPVVDITYDEDVVSLGCANHYVVTRTWTAMDDCGNSATAQQIVTVMDEQAPALVNVPEDITVDCEAGLVLSPTATDNCTADMDVVISMSADTTNLNCLNSYIVIRTWTATDACNNSAVASQVITVVDDTAPVLAGLPADMDVECNAVPAPASPTATDNCDADVTINFVQISTADPDINDCGHYNFTLNRTWTATDNCGNVDVYTQIITVRDRTEPVFSVPANVTIECSQVDDFTATGSPGGIFDNCDPEPETTYTDVITSLSCGNNFLITRTWTVTDACNNGTTDQQLITVEDTVEPVLNTPAQSESIPCAMNMNADAAFAAWLGNNGGAVATDNCSTPLWFAAVPGSYQLNDPATWPGIDPGGFDFAACPSPTQGMYRSETVDFIFYDDCNNAIVTTATFAITDNTAPVFTFCPPDMDVNVEAGTCEGTAMLPTPIISEECESLMDTYGPAFISAPITSTAPGNVEVPVDPVVMTFTGLPVPPTAAVGSATLIINLENVDGEESTEFFYIQGEDGTTLGVTTPTSNGSGVPVQCGNSTTFDNSILITESQLNTWGLDGELTITLVPNIPTGLPGQFAVNDICGGSMAEGILEFGTQSPNNVRFAYSVNGGAYMPGPIASNTETLPVGANQISYQAIDCAGNESYCNFVVNIIDNELPTVACPADFAIPSTDCFPQNATLARPIGISDNCGFLSDYYQTSTVQNITFDEHPNLDAFVANDVAVDFFGNYPPPTGDGILTVYMQADVDDPTTEFFTISVEGETLGVTNTISGTETNCLSFVATTFNVSLAQLQNWTSNGSVNVMALANTATNISASADQDWNNDDQGVNPCVFGSSTYNGFETTVTDVNSNIYMELTYSAAVVTYAVSGPTTIETTPFPNDGSGAEVVLNPGNNSVTYAIYDENGNIGTCTYNINVGSATLPTPVLEITTAPVCPTDMITLTDVSGFTGTNPSWLWYHDAEPLGTGGADVVIATTDSPTVTFPGMEGSNSYYAIITDENCTSSPSASVTIEGAIPLEFPMISASSNPVCTGEDVTLVVNNPQSDYVSYQWTGPNGYSSNQQYPTVITDVQSFAAGDYILTISNAQGCTATDTLNLLVNDAGDAPSLVATQPLCPGEDIVLSTSSVCDIYVWIGPDGDSPLTLENPLLVTTVPTTSIPEGNVAYDEGIWTLMCLDNAGCPSTLSDPVNVVINDPIAAGPQSNGPVCEGDNIQLSAPVLPGANYNWSGPDNFTSTEQNPLILDASLTNDGLYNLIITDFDGCTGSGSTMVSVLSTPVINSVTSSITGCVTGEEDATLSADVSPADDGSYLYTWTGPGNFSSSDANPVIPGVSEDDNGSYTLVVSNAANCASAPMTVVINVDDAPTPPVIMTDNQVCEGEDIELTTTAVPGVTYNWEGPAGFMSNLMSPVINDVNGLNAGLYSLTVTDPSGCSATASTTISIDFAPVVTAVSNNGMSCANGTADVVLSPTVFPPDAEYDYTWVGPNGFTSTDSMPVLPFGTSLDNGSYTVYVTNQAGCESNAMTTVVNLTDAPETPLLDGPAFLCEGETLTIMANPYSGSSVVYNWTTPLGAITTSTPALTISVTTINDSGEYGLVVAVDGCSSNASSPIDVAISTLPSSPIATSNTPVCEGDVIQLSTPLIPGATYLWSGPNLFNSSLQNPQIFNADLEDAGAYTVEVSLGGCASDISMPVVVEVNPKPAAPVITNNGPVCLDDGNAALVLSVTPESAIPGATYTWFDAITDEQIGGPTPALDLTLTDLTGLMEGIYNYYVVADLNGCSSTGSVPTAVAFNEAPDEAANAGDDIQICDGAAVNLNATEPTQGTGMWIQTGGPFSLIANATSASTAVSGLAGGNVYTYAWVLSNGACTNYATDEVQVFVDAVTEIADAGEEIMVCNVNNVTLDATLPISGVAGIWSQEASQEALGVNIVDPENPNTEITGLVPGSMYGFTWTLSNNGCGEFASDEVVVMVTNAGSDLANGGPDVSTCGDMEVELIAGNTAVGGGTWSSPDLGIDIFTPNQFSTVVSDLESGENILIWSLSTPECGVFSVDTVIVTLQMAPQANADNYAVPFNSSLDFNVADNDVTGGNSFVVSIIDAPSRGELVAGENGEFTYTGEIGFVGTETFTYSICLADCPDECTEATVTLVVGDDAGCVIPTIFTPNNDGVNDQFMIPCLGTGRYPDAEVAVFNQWGDEVYRSSSYQNNWSGLYNGEDLPVGTYFYVVDFGSNEASQSGFLVLER